MNTATAISEYHPEVVSITSPTVLSDGTVSVYHNLRKLVMHPPQILSGDLKKALTKLRQNFNKIESYNQYMELDNSLAISNIYIKGVWVCIDTTPQGVKYHNCRAHAKMNRLPLVPLTPHDIKVLLDFLNSPRSRYLFANSNLKWVSFKKYIALGKNNDKKFFTKGDYKTVISR